MSLVAFDWEMAGYGIPAPDIAEAFGRGTHRRWGGSNMPHNEMVDYWTVVRDAWPDLDLAAINELVDLGAVFRLILAISWESWDIERGWWPIEELRGYQENMSVVLKHLRLAQR